MDIPNSRAAVTSHDAATSSALAASDARDAVARHLDRLSDYRNQARTRHSHALTTLMTERHDLYGVNALADIVADATRWSA